MAFDKKTWANNQGGGTPLDASGLNDLESRIADSIDELDKGVIVESGFGVNGYYRKWVDGSVDMWHKFTVDLSSLAIWTSVDYVWTLPTQVLEGTLHITATARGSGGLNGNVNSTFVGSLLTDTDNATIRSTLMSKESTQTECGVCVEAHGRWK